MTRSPHPLPDDVLDLARRLGGSVYVYDLDEVVARGRRVARYGAGAELLFSMKANPNRHVVEALCRAGLGVDVSSAAEASVAGALVDGPERRLLMTGPGKTEHDLEAYLRAGGRLLSAESPTEIGRIAEAATRSGHRARVLLRVAADDGRGPLGRGRGGHFGMDDAGVAAALDRAAAAGMVDVVGLHTFPGSNAPDPERFVGTMRRSLVAAGRLLPRLTADELVVDLGGGFPAPFGRVAGDDYLDDVAPFLDEVPDRLAAMAGGRAVRVLYETGRAVVGPGGHLVTRVLDVKSLGGRRIVVLASGVNHLIGSVAVTGRPARALDLQVVPAAGGARPTGVVDVVGPLCAPFDVLARDVTCPVPRPDDLVVIPGVGAYGLTAGLVGFLSRPPAVEVCVKEGDVIAIDELRLSRSPVGRPPDRAGAR